MWVTTGDPLSHFMFLLAAEGLNVMMQAMVEGNRFLGYRVGGREVVTVSHLQFADDTLFLSQFFCSIRIRSLLSSPCFKLKFNYISKSLY
jgi:hypothetical protein